MGWLLIIDYIYDNKSMRTKYKIEQYFLYKSFYLNNKKLMRTKYKIEQYFLCKSLYLKIEEY